MKIGGYANLAVVHNFEVREQTTRGPMRAFIEWDFKGDASSFRLRHAFGQYSARQGHEIKPFY